MNKSRTSKPKVGGPIGPHADRRGGAPRGLAARIIAARLRKGLSQEAAAKRIGVGRSTLAQWEIGVQPMGLYRKALDAWMRRV